MDNQLVIEKIIEEENIELPKQLSLQEVLDEFINSVNKR